MEVLQQHFDGNTIARLQSYTYSNGQLIFSGRDPEPLLWILGSKDITARLNELDQLAGSEVNTWREFLLEYSSTFAKARKIFIDKNLSNSEQYKIVGNIVCRNCRQKTAYKVMTTQTRSADESADIIIQCGNCGIKYKIRGDDA